VPTVIESPRSIEAGVPAWRGSGPSAEPSLVLKRLALDRSGPKQILVVDDEPEIRGLVARLVTQAGFEADIAEDGEEGWRALCTTGYDLVITDYLMPRLNGLNLIRRLRDVSAEPPCVLISSCLPEPVATVKQLIQPGAVLEKPFKPAVLIEIVYSLLLMGTYENL
jgi:DNA-binding response OmpR family regulator